jgi:predicted dehydrogenase
MSNAKLKFGLLGCGAAGMLHAEAIASCPETELVLVADVDERMAREVARRYGVPHVGSAEELLADVHVAAVSIALPHHLHYEYGLQAAAAGKHAIIEKPFTTSSAHGRELIEVFARQGLTLSAWLERRYMPFAAKARELLQTGMAGRLIYITINVLGYKPRAYWEYGMRNETFPSQWRKSWETSAGGPLMMNGIHQIDLVRYITGLEVIEVYARMGTFYHDVEVEDTIAVMLEFDNGALGRIDCSCAAYGAGTFPIQHKRDYLYGTDGYLFLSAPLETYDRVYEHRVHDVPVRAVPECKALEVADFARAVAEGRPHGAFAEEILKSRRVVEAAYESAQSRLPVRV